MGVRCIELFLGTRPETAFRDEQGRVSYDLVLGHYNEMKRVEKEKVRRAQQLA